MDPCGPKPGLPPFGGPARAGRAGGRADPVRLTADEREFLDASVAHRDAGVVAERMRHERELTLERRARGRLRGLVAVLAAALVVAASLTALSVSRGREVGHQRDENTINALAGAALSNLGTDPELSVLLALQAIDLGAERGRIVPADTVGALHWAMQEAGVEYPVGRVALPWSPVRSGCEAYSTSHCRPWRMPPAESHALAHIGPVRPVPRHGYVPGPADTFPADLEAEPIKASRRLGPAAVRHAGDIVRRVRRTSGGSASRRVRPLHAADGHRGQVGRQSGYQDYVSDSVAAGGRRHRGPPQPGTVRDLARQGHLIDLGTYVDVDRLKQVQSPYLVSLGTVGDDGSWPASEGSLYGAFVSVNLKSMI